MYEAIDEALSTIINPKITNTNIAITKGLSSLVLFFIVSLYSLYINNNKESKKSKQDYGVNPFFDTLKK